MQQNKLFLLLQNFTSRQWNSLGAFLKSPYFNTNQELVRFYDVLSDYFPTEGTAAASRAGLEARWGKSGKDLAYDMSRFLKMTERFLATEHWMCDAYSVEKHRLAALFEAGSVKTASKALRKSVEALEENACGDMACFRHKLDLALLAYQNDSDPYRHQYNPLLQTASDLLDQYYLLQKLRLLCETGSQENIISRPYSAVLAEALEERITADEPVLYAWYLAWQLTRSDNGTLFHTFKTHLEAWKSVIPATDRKALYTYASNFCTRQVNRHNLKEYYLHYLEIVDILIAEDLFLEDGKLLPWRYLNIVNAGLSTEQWDKTRSFIEQWKDHLPPDYREHLYTFCLARWHYGRNEHEQAQRLLSTVEFKDVLLSLSVRSLLIRIYFETGEDDLLSAALEACRLYLLRNNNMQPQLKGQMQAFIECTRKLHRLFPKDEKNLQALRDSLPPAREILHRDWLLAQMSR